MDYRPQAWGRVRLATLSAGWKQSSNTDTCVCAQPRDDIYGAYDASYLQTNGPKTVTQSPVVTGTSVIAIKFKDGVVMAADNLGTRSLLPLPRPNQANPTLTAPIFPSQPRTAP